MPHEKGQGAAFSFDNLTHSWVGAVELAIAIGVTYFLAARFGLALRAHVGVAIFWPAAGIAVGALIALGRTSRLPVAVGVLTATITSSLTIGRNLWLSVAFGFVNVGQALIMAWLIERWFGRRFKLEDVPQVLGFLMASAVGAAAGAAGAALAVTFSHPAPPFPGQVWRLWFAACLLGTFTVAPLLIGLAEAVRQPPPRREVVEGAVGFVILAALSTFLISLPQEPWESALPVVLVFPVLLWVTVRCRPVFAAAAAFVVAFAIIWSAVLNTGHFGDAGIPLESRIFAAQTHVLAGALLALVLAALFADRRRSEEALSQNHKRLQLALDGAELGAFSVDLATGRLDCDARSALMHGHNVPPLTIKEGRRFVHRDDLVPLDAAFEEVMSTGGTWRTEYRVLYPRGHQLAGETRWIAFEGTVLCSSQGKPITMLGIARDITQRKRAIILLSESKARLADALAAGQVMAFEWDAVTGQSLRSENAAGILGFKEADSSPYSKFLSHVHSDDRASVKKRIRELSPGNPSYALSFRYVRADGRQVWLEETAKGEFDAKGKLLRIKGLTRDITARKRAEERQQVLAGELDHRVKNVLATVSVVASRTRDSSRSMDAFVAALDGRIKSMATTHELLSHRQWQGLPLRELVRRELTPYAAGSNTDIHGPEVILIAEAGQVMAMVLHELATNAAKHGALSAKYGRVSIRWHWQLNGSYQLAFRWQEHGGPVVGTPSNSGYGMSLICEAIPYELGGTADFATTPEGVRCELVIPVDWFDKNSRPCDSETAPQRLSALRS